MHFEELAVGQVFSAPDVVVTKEQIIDFAVRFDPQPIHLDEDFAAKGPFEGLIASGMHTLSLAWGAWVRTGLIAEHSRGGLGLEDVRFHEAVRPDDLLRVQATVGQLRVTSGGHGLCRLDFDIRGREDRPILTFKISFLIERRSTAAGTTPPISA